MPGNQKPNRASAQHINTNRHSPHPATLRENQQKPRSPEYYKYCKKKKYYEMLRRRKRKFIFCMRLLGAGIVLLLAILWYRAAVAPKDPPASSSTAANSEPSSTQDDGAWALILANTQNPLPENYEDTVVYTYAQEPTSEQQCDARILSPLTSMLNAASAEGYSLFFRSGYRSFATQTYLFDTMYQENLATGLTEEEAYTATKSLRNIPGTSEHETGLAVDLVPLATPFIDLTDELENTPEIKWLHEHCAEYGFILRYPKEKTDITGTSYEPWHFRYVGVEHAKKIMESGLTLEEYLLRSNGG